MHDPASASGGTAPELRPAGTAWLLLVLLSLAMLGNYYVYDSVAPVADLLSSQRGLSDTQIGSLNAVYSLPNILMVLIGGVIIDRIGATRGTTLFAGVCALGALWFAYADGYTSMVIARLLFGLGAESMIIGVSTSIGHWFGARQLGLALGLNLSLARAGSYAADISPDWAKSLYDQGVDGPLLLAAGFAIVSVSAAAIAWFVDARSGMRPPKKSGADEKFRWSDIYTFPKSYWYLVGMCVTIYSVLLPFRSTFAIKYFQDAYGMSREAAGHLNGTVFLAAIFATPVFGLLLDRPGRRGGSLLFGALILLPVFPMLLWTDWSPTFSNVLLGLAYSLVPAVMWPCMTRLVEADRLGTAYGVIFMIQNAGLTAGNLAAGKLNDVFEASATNPGGYQGMLWFFAILATLALWFALLLRREAHTL